MSQPNTTEESSVLVEVQNLVKYYPVRTGLLQRVGDWVQAVDDVSFSIRQGETFGLVGESGCGKTTIGLTMVRLLEATAGRILFEGQDILSVKGAELKELRRQLQLIFQDPYSALHPRMQVSDSVSEGLRIHNIGSAQDRYERAIEILEKVGLKPFHARRYPHEFSGGQRQRIGIARALALQPKFIVADEPVSALDVSIQAQMLNLLKDLQEEFDLTYLFIAHDLSVVGHISDRIGVMYLGKIAELATSEALFANPLHPYTQALMSAIPVLDPRHQSQRIILEGDVPSPLNPPTGCRFHTRCPIAVDQCRNEEPPFVEVRPDHWAACWLVD
jgi:peptide/nickel transport system ATP-binding protein/oligopeptide transport system ATP-binding protein